MIVCVLDEYAYGILGVKLLTSRACSTLSTSMAGLLDALALASTSSNEVVLSLFILDVKKSLLAEIFVDSIMVKSEIQMQPMLYYTMYAMQCKHKFVSSALLCSHVAGYPGDR